MAWLDKLTTIPTFGLLHQTQWVASASMAQRVAELMDKWAIAGRLGTMTPREAYTAQFEIDDVQVTLSLNNMVFQYVNKVTVTGRTGNLQLKETVRESPITFTERMERVRALFLEIVPHIYGSHAIKVIRAGLHVACAADEASLPPGAQRYIDHLAQPWGGRKNLLDVQSTVVATLAEGKGIRDQCFHILKRTPDGQTVELALDWQRLYDTPSERLGRAELSESLSDWLSMASDYFEKFGEGDLKYADDDSDSGSTSEDAGGPSKS